MSLLRWERGERSDITDLQLFECTTPGKRVRIGSSGKYRIDHPKMWERKVQAKIRTFEPPYSPPHHMFVGRDDDGIGAVIMLEELDGPAQVELCYGGVARRFRGKGGGVADEMMSKALDEITALALAHGVDMVEVVGQVHEKNQYSQELCRRTGMRHTGQVAPDSPFQQWSRLLPIAGALELE